MNLRPLLKRPHNQSLHNKESLLVLRLFNFPSELSCHFKAHIMTFTGMNHCQCPLEHVPNINKDIKICNVCRVLIQQTSTLQQVYLRDFPSQTVTEDVLDNGNLEGFGEKVIPE